jgi:TRAP transporter 4TM/12TM fusion protein
MFTLMLVYLTMPAAKHRVLRSLDLVFAVVGAFVAGYVTIFAGPLLYTPGKYTRLETWLAVIGLLLIAEGSRRATGLAIPIFSGLFFLYAIAGHLLSGPFSHRVYSFERTVNFLFYSLEGIFGVALGVSASYVFMFVLFGIVYAKAGGGEFLISLATSLLGHVRGGPAKMAVLGSCMFGSISGAAVANVVGTGSVTIPLMKKVGYRPHFAGAVEAAASSGGQIMPPVMGGAAFVMADILGISYWSVCKAALIPALLYYWAVYEAVDFQAAKHGLKGVPREEVPQLREVMRKYWPLTLPLVAMVAMLGILQQSPERAAVIAVGMCVVLIILKSAGSYVQRCKAVVRVIEEGAKDAVGIAATCACVGVIVGVIMMSGAGFKLAGILTALSGGNMWLLLVLAMTASLILGMGLPVTACYLLVVLMIIPPLLDFGIRPIVAHLFSLFFGVMSNVTPPFAMAAVAGAGLAGADPMRTGFQAFALVTPSFIVAYSFMSRPEILMEGGNWALTGVYTAAAALGVSCFAAAQIGYVNRHFNWFERVLLIALSVVFIISRDFLVLGVCALVAGLFALYSRRHPAAGRSTVPQS